MKEGHLLERDVVVVAEQHLPLGLDGECKCGVILQMPSPDDMRNKGVPEEDDEKPAAAKPTDPVSRGGVKSSERPPGRNEEREQEHGVGS